MMHKKTPSRETRKGRAGASSSKDVLGEDKYKLGQSPVYQEQDKYKEDDRERYEDSGKHYDISREEGE